MVSEGVGSIFRRTDGKYFVHLPRALVEDTAFPFPPEKSVKVKIRLIARQQEAGNSGILAVVTVKKRRD